MWKHINVVYCSVTTDWHQSSNTPPLKVRYHNTIYCFLESIFVSSGFFPLHTPQSFCHVTVYVKALWHVHIDSRGLVPRQHTAEWHVTIWWVLDNRSVRQFLSSPAFTGKVMFRGWREEKSRGGIYGSLCWFEWFCSVQLSSRCGVTDHFLFFI